MTRFAIEQVNPYPFYSPRFWAGMNFSDYVSLLAEGRFRIHPMRYAMAVLVGGCAAVSSGLSLTQRLLLNRKIADVEIEPPIFVIGHWRSGTTLLHELLALDSQFTYPTTFQCFVPGHFLISQSVLEPLVRLLLPSKRPMDGMAAGVGLPQEDEFALLGMGAPTPYRHIAFCKEPASHLEMLNFRDADPQEVETVRRSLEWFYKSVSLKSAGRLVVKSPTHTGRIGELARWFPGARFVHISRNPYKVFPSTVHLWRSLVSVQGYQLPPASDDEFGQYVHECYERMYDGYFDGRDQLPADSLLEIRFEELVKDPVSVVNQIYKAFDLPGFEEARPRIRQYWSARENHRVNKTTLNSAAREAIDERWRRYLREFGYAHAPTLNARVG